LNEHQIANSLFDMIHIAGTAGTSALLGSVIGVLCLDDALRNDVVSEINAVWNGNESPNAYALEQSTLINKVILETARLYPPVRFVSQLATEPGEVEIGERRCPFQKGTRFCNLDDLDRRNGLTHHPKGCIFYGWQSTSR
jgi:cytochrome P450